jgi:hypothetical protein
MTIYPKSRCSLKHLPDFSVQAFDNIYDKEISKRYTTNMSYRVCHPPKERVRERELGAGRSFKLDVRDRFLMLLIYYRLYITYTLAGFLFYLAQSNIDRGIQKIGPLIRICLPIPQKIYGITKKLKTLEKVEQYFPGFLSSFVDCTKQSIQDL